ncbi:MAG: hypothetical protein EAZ97_01235 [Bacteroidetes bacterium]|nr:MAG: hypothetical protein EAZ97_01235 [Bacteroidota bacterium]
MKIVADVSEKIGLKNLTFEVNRVEKIENKLFDFVVSRGVTEIANLYFWTRNLFEKKSNHEFSNGIFCLKGGDLKEEFQNFNRHHRFFDIKEFFTEEFFESKKVVYVKVT